MGCLVILNKTGKYFENDVEYIKETFNASV